MSLPSQIRRSLEELLALTGSEEVREIEVERHSFGGWRIRVSRGAVVAAADSPASALVPRARSKEVAAPAAQEGEFEAGSGEPIRSPMVGMFYRSPAPDADPFVKEGDIVTAGQTVCIIEAMKIMNEIEAEVGGRVTGVLVENGKPVEYNTPLFVVEPA